MDAYNPQQDTSTAPLNKGMTVGKILILASIPLILLAAVIGGAVYINNRNNAQQSSSDAENAISDTAQQNQEGNGSGNTGGTTPTPTAGASVTVTPTPASATSSPNTSTLPSANTEGEGIIEGTVRFPEGVQAKNLQVCAESITKSFIRCINSSSDRYLISLPVDEYNVFAINPSTGERSYYNDYVVECMMNNCGTKFDNKFHNSIPVRVSPDVIVRKINLWDWSK
jgi:hypothetical protein